MVDDEKYEVAFEIIACAGDAKSLALMAIEEARNGNFEQAEKNLAEARDGQGARCTERYAAERSSGQERGTEHRADPRRGSPDHGNHVHRFCRRVH